MSDLYVKKYIRQFDWWLGVGDGQLGGGGGEGLYGQHIPSRKPHIPGSTHQVRNHTRDKDKMTEEIGYIQETKRI